MPDCASLRLHLSAHPLSCRDSRLTPIPERTPPMKTRVANPTLAETIDRYTVLGDPALCWREGEHIRCLACGHRCLIGDGLRGICKVRYNEGGRAQGPLRLRRRLAVRSGREEAVLPRLPRQRCADVRNARMRLSMLLLSKLVDLSSVARPRCRRPAAPGHARRNWSTLPAASGPGWSSPATTSRSSPPNGPSPSSARRRPPGWPAPLSPTATPRPKCSTSSAPGSSAYKVDLKSL